MKKITAQMEAMKWEMEVVPRKCKEMQQEKVAEERTRQTVSEKKADLDHREER